MRKMSSLFTNTRPADAYIIGTIYAYCYKVNNGYLSVFLGKNQKKTNHTISLSDFDDQLLRLKKFYKDDRFDEYKIISYNDEVSQSVKGSIGYFDIYENDLREDIEDLIYKMVTNKELALNFIRGIIDSRSSADKTFQYIAMDIKKKTSLSFTANLVKAFNVVFSNVAQYNINPRFRQPAKISRLKNPQFRVPYTVVFGAIGTFRIQFFEKMKLNASQYNKFKGSTIIPASFDSLILWDTSNVPYSPRVNNEKMLEGDVSYVNNYSPETEEINYKKLSEKFVDKIKNKSKINSISQSLKEEVVNELGNFDFLDNSLEIDKSKRLSSLLDFHHVIPKEFRYILEYENDIHDVLNIVPLRPDTHDFLHHGQMNEKKIKYLEKLFEHIKPFIKKYGLENSVTFDVFKRMY